MAHELNFDARRGTYSFASNSEKAWHGLGQVVQGAMTAAQAIELANLDFEVQKRKVFYESPDVEYPTEIPNHYATVRADNNKILGVVRSRYEIVQNTDAFAFFDSIVDEGEAIYETAGVLGDGQRVFLLAKLPEDFHIGGESIERYIMLYNSHDGTSSVIAGLTPIRIVCNNTLQAALRSVSNKVSIHHVSGVKDKLKEAARVMGIASKYTESVKEVFERMIDVKMSEGQYIDYFMKVYKPEIVTPDNVTKEASTRLQNIVFSTADFALSHPTQTTPEANGTLWGAYNAVSGYYNYVKTFKSREDKFKSQYFGDAEKKMLKSFKLANDILQTV